MILMHNIDILYIILYNVISSRLVIHIHHERSFKAILPHFTVRSSINGAQKR